MTHELEFIVNPRAGGFVRNGALADLLRAVRAAGLAVWQPLSMLELAEVARGIGRRRPQMVVVAGGDGTLREVISALHRENGEAGLPRLSFLPAGTVCRVVRNWRGSHTERGTLQDRYLGAVLPATTARPSLAIRLDGEPPRIGFVVGTGLVSRFFAEYERHGSGGTFAAARIVARTFIGAWLGTSYTERLLEPMPLRLRVNGSVERDSAYSLVLCSVLKDVGLGFRVNYRAGEGAATPHLVACPLPALALGRRAMRVWRGRRISSAGFDGLVSEFQIEFPDPGPLLIDGDLFHARRVSVEGGPVLQVHV